VNAAPVFTALADPMRRDLLNNLAENGPKTATRLAQDYPRAITRQGIRKHLGVLAAAGLVSVEQFGRDKRYGLTPAPLAEVDQWITELNTKWDERLLRLKRFVESVEGEQP
jgi:DNA-binding transcriptional ArsR family regulator